MVGSLAGPGIECTDKLAQGLLRIHHQIASSISRRRGTTVMRSVRKIFDKAEGTAHGASKIEGSKP